MTNRHTFLALAALLVCGTATAQEYGQWSWEATLSAGHRSYRNTINGESTNDFRQRDLHFFFGVNGFIVHPAIASFTAGVEASATRYPSKSAVDSNQRGFRANMAILPESLFPLQLYAVRQNYDYQIRPEADGLTMFSIPDRGTSYGGRFRLRGGALRGLEGAVDRTTIEVVGAARSSDVWNRDTLDWSRGSHHVQQHYRLERQVRSFAQSDYRLNDLLARAEEQGTLGRWHWSAFGNALRREFSTAGTPTPAITIGRVTSLLTSENHDRPAWSFTGESDYAGGAASALTTHRVEARYARPRKHGFQWSPSASYTVQTAEGLRVRAPGAGVSASWTRNAGVFDLTATTGTGVFRLTSSGRNAIPDQTNVSYSGGFSLGHATSDRLRENLEAGVSRNQLRTSSVVEGQPGFGAVGSAGLENARQARLTVTGRAGRITANAYSDWAARESTLALPGRGFSTTTLMHTLQLSSRRLSVTATSGDTDVTTNVTQKVHFLGGSLSVSPFPFISFSGNYRKDRRDAIFEPRVDGERLEAGASIRIGAIYLNPLAFWTTERLEGGAERKNRGFTVSVSRQFGGFLPIVSAPRRRGTIQ